MIGFLLDGFLKKNGRRLNNCLSATALDCVGEAGEGLVVVGSGVVVGGVVGGGGGGGGGGVVGGGCSVVETSVLEAS